MPIIKDSIVQLNDDFEIVKKWDCTQDIAKNLSESETLAYQAFDQAIKKLYRSHGYFWMLTVDYDNGIRPPVTIGRRNLTVYAYQPTQQLKPSEYNDLTVEIDFTKLKFLGKYKNAVMCAICLKIDVSNIRCVIHGQRGDGKTKRLHRGYYFSYVPLNPSDADAEITQPTEREIKEYRRKQKKYIKA